MSNRRPFSPVSTTIAARVQESELSDLRARLEAHSTTTGFAAIPTLHVARVLILDSSTVAANQPLLLMNLVHDGDVRDHLLAVVKHNEWFAAILRDFTAFVPSEGTLVDWMLNNRLEAKAFFVSAAGLSADDIRGEESLRRFLSSTLDQELASGQWTLAEDPEKLRKHLRQRALGDPAHAAYATEPLREPVGNRIRRGIRMLATLLVPVSGLLLPEIYERFIRGARGPFGIGARLAAAPLFLLYACYTLPPTLAVLCFVRLLELVESKPNGVAPPSELSQAVLAGEDHGVLNQLTMYTPVKPTLFRRAVLRLVLWGASAGTKHLWDNGKLAGIDTILFARLFQFDGHRRFLFLSDYAGSWNRYLGDFLSVGRRAVVPIWTNLHQCPRTRFLFRPSKGFATGFLPFTRAHQVPVSLWYQAYPDIAPRQIRENRGIRTGLAATSMTSDAAAQWIKLL